RDPEVVATAAAARPQQIRVIVPVGVDYPRRVGAVGHHDLRRDQLVARQTHSAGEQSESTTENHASQADLALRTGRNGVPAFAHPRHRLFLHETGADGGRARRLVDVDVLQPADVDDQAAVDGRPAFEVVPSAAGAEGDPHFERVADGVDDIGGVAAEHD